jgi:monoterpene epsilon-lactone hydrolase
MNLLSLGIIVGAFLAVATQASAQQSLNPKVDETGTITGAISSVPISSFLSPEAKAQLTERLRNASPPSLKDGIEAVRKGSADAAKAQLAGWLKIHPATITETMIGSVRTDVVIPKSGIDPKNKNRVLLNAHMGGFFTGARYGGQVESVPLAGRGKIKVIAVDYRLSPEHVFPAASEDMETVYREVLKTTKPANIGIFGCSAGGTLVAQSMAWFQKKKLPLPGAIGIFCSGAMPSFWFGGDSAQLSALLNASLPAGEKPANAPRGYFDGIEMNDPLVTPGSFPDVLAKFPPTLVVTGTRDIAMSNAIVTHAKLLEAGVGAQLFVQEGLGHGHFFSFPGTPESKTAYDVIWRFFDTNLKN